MAKNLFFLAAGALALTACTSQDVIEDVAKSRNAIQFENVVSKPTRAVSDLTNATLEQFKVFGFYTMPDNAMHAHALFNDARVWKDGSLWTYGDNLKYWVDGATYYFYAYSCDNASKLSEGLGDFSVDMDDKDGDGKPASDRVLKITDYICDNTHQHDLIFASNTGYVGKANMNDDVAFEFKHILTKLQAKFTSKFGSEYTVVIKNVRVENVCNEADYDFTSGWNQQVRKAGTPLVYLLNTTGSGIETAETPVSVKNEVDAEGNQVAVATESAYTIPMDYTTVTDSNVYLIFDVDVMYGDNRVISKTLKATFQPSWKEGYSYIYNVEISPEALKLGAITFTVTTVNGWESEKNFDGKLNID